MVWVLSTYPGLQRRKSQACRPISSQHESGKLGSGEASKRSSDCRIKRTDPNVLHHWNKHLHRWFVHSQEKTLTQEQGGGAKVWDLTWNVLVLTGSAWFLLPVFGVFRADGSAGQLEGPEPSFRTGPTLLLIFFQSFHHHNWAGKIIPAPGGQVRKIIIMVLLSEMERSSRI